MSRKLIASIEFGKAQGRIALPTHILENAEALAKSFYETAVETEFSDEVHTFSLESWLTENSDQWIPSVAHLGLKPTKCRGEIVATAGVDQHEDHAHGYVLLIVLHNDGLKFKQGRASHEHLAGDWYIFNDRLNHGVKETKKSGAYIGWSIPLDVL